MRYRLKMKRKFYQYTQKSFAKAIGISESGYKKIELGLRNPGYLLAIKIMEKLKADFTIFKNSTKPTLGQVTENICDYMNLKGKKKYEANHVSFIRKSIKLELQDRKKQNIQINGKTENGKWEIYERTASIANKEFNINFSSEDIRLYKECRQLEYEDRTGRCSWSIPDARKKFGYNPQTGRTEI